MLIRREAYADQDTIRALHRRAFRRRTAAAGWAGCPLNRSGH